jgi:ABC-type branched-subunit amino acid transport system substrate-binding protein
MASAGCLPVARPTVTIGLVAPFEGRYRDVGYEVIYAVRLAVREANAAGGVAGYNVALLALDDGGSAENAVEQARKLVVAPEVVGAIGHWLEGTTVAAAPVYVEAGLPMVAAGAAGRIAPGRFRLWLTDDQVRASVTPTAQQCPPPCDSLEELDWLIEARAADPTTEVFGPALWGQPQFVALAGEAAEGVAFVTPAPYPADTADPGFADRYRAISNGIEPRSNAVLAYDAARLLLAAIEASMTVEDAPTREGVGTALGTLTFSGLSGTIRFDAAGDWTEVKAWVYRWVAGVVGRG